MDNKFECPYCQQRLSATEDLYGLTLDCPACGNTLQIPEEGPQEAMEVRVTFIPSKDETISGVPPSDATSTGKHWAFHGLYTIFLLSIGFCILQSPWKPSAEPQISVLNPSSIATPPVPTPSSKEESSQKSESRTEALHRLEQMQTEHNLRLQELARQAPEISIQPILVPPEPETHDWESSTIDGWQELRSPTPILKLVPAKGWRVLILQNKDRAGLRMYDLDQQQIIQEFPYINQPDILFAAGGNRLVTYQPHTDQLSLYSLSPRASGTVQILNRVFNKKIAGIWMGNASSNNLFVRLVDEGGRKKMTELRLFRLGTLQQLPAMPSKQTYNHLPEISLSQSKQNLTYASSDGFRLLDTKQNSDHNYMSVYVDKGRSLDHQSRKKGYIRFALLGDDDRIYSIKGIDPSTSVFENPGHILEGFYLIPCPGGQAFLAVDPETARVTLWDTQTFKAICALPPIPFTEKEKKAFSQYPRYNGPRWFPEKSHIHFDPVSGDYLVIPPGGTRILHRKIDLQTIAQNPFIFTRLLPEIQWTANEAPPISLEVISNDPNPKILLSKAPAGMTLTPDHQLLWPASDGYPSPFVHISLDLSTSTGFTRNVSLILEAAPQP